jgi:hypothetical protein
MVIHAYKEVRGDPTTLDIGAVVRTSEIWLAASKSLPDDEAKRWADAFEQVKADGTYARILQKYDRMKVLPIEDDLRRYTDDPFLQVRQAFRAAGGARGRSGQESASAPGSAHDTITRGRNTCNESLASVRRQHRARSARAK